MHTNAGTKPVITENRYFSAFSVDIPISDASGFTRVNKSIIPNANAEDKYRYLFLNTDASKLSSVDNAHAINTELVISVTKAELFTDVNDISSKYADFADKVMTAPLTKPQIPGISNKF